MTKVGTELLMVKPYPRQTTGFDFQKKTAKSSKAILPLKGKYPQKPTF